MLKPNDQVMVRRKLPNGTLVRVGSVLRIDHEAGEAVVHFPIDHTQARVPVEQLQLTSEVYPGRTRVQSNPVLRKA